MRTLIASAILGLTLIGGTVCATESKKELYLCLMMAEQGDKHGYFTKWFVTSDANEPNRVCNTLKMENFPSSKGYVDQRVVVISVGRGLIDLVAFQ